MYYVSIFSHTKLLVSNRILQRSGSANEKFVPRHTLMSATFRASLKDMSVEYEVATSVSRDEKYFLAVNFDCKI